ncbi:MAG: dockerin type I domain-containing protein [Planctomycetota bacterium]|jgi:hypothetical protein
MFSHLFVITAGVVASAAAGSMLSAAEEGTEIQEAAADIPGFSSPPIEASAWTNHPIPTQRAFGITHIPGEEGLHRWVVAGLSGNCRKLNWDFSDTGEEFDCSTSYDGDSNYAIGIVADSTYFYVTLTAGIGGGHSAVVERYLHDGTFVDVLIDRESLIRAGFCCGHFSVSGITLDDSGRLYIAGGALFENDNVAVFDKETGEHLATWSNPPFCPYGIAWVESFSNEGIVCGHPDGCVIVSQYGTTPGNDCQYGSGPLHVYSPDGSINYGQLPASGQIRQAGLDIGTVDLEGIQHGRVLWLGHFAHQSISQFVVPLACPWDLNGDGVVNVLDLIELVMSFGPCEGCPADFDDDGFVNVVDLIALIMNFGPCPGTPCVWDVNGDGIVDQSDVEAVTANLGPCEDPDNCPWDVNGDGVVNGSDVQAVATHFGPCP